MPNTFNDVKYHKALCASSFFQPSAGGWASTTQATKRQSKIKILKIKSSPEPFLSATHPHS